MAKFMLADKVRIKNYKSDPEQVGQLGTIVEMQDLSGTPSYGKTTALYRVRVDDKILPKWRFDEDLEEIEE